MDSPLTISFDVKIDKTKSELLFESGKIQDNKLSLTFYNPSEVGTSGLSAPLGLLILEKDILGLRFQLTD